MRNWSYYAALLILYSQLSPKSVTELQMYHVGENRCVVHHKAAKCVTLGCKQWKLFILVSINWNYLTSDMMQTITCCNWALSGSPWSGSPGYFTSTLLLIIWLYRFLPSYRCRCTDLVLSHNEWDTAQRLCLWGHLGYISLSTLMDHVYSSI